MAKNRILNEEQQTRIAGAVAEAEKKTSGEIVPMVVRRSDDYPGTRWLFAVVLSLLATFGLAFNHVFLDPVFYVWAQLPAIAIGYWLGGFGPIQRLLLPDALTAQEVHQRALQAFNALSISSTQDRTGILILVSLLEHRVEILADAGIHAKAPAGTWDALVAKLLNRIREGSLTEGLCEAVLECGRVLERDFPRKPGDVNELKDLVWIEE